jgi:hypothetical protein
MNTHDLICHKKSLLTTINEFKENSGDKYHTLSLQLLSPCDDDFTVLKDCVLKIKIYNLDFPWGSLSYKCHINEHSVYIDKNGKFLVERPLYDNGYVVHIAQTPGPSKYVWECLIGKWLDSFCPRLRQVKRVQILREELLSKITSNYLYSQDIFFCRQKKVFVIRNLEIVNYRFLYLNRNLFLKLPGLDRAQ